MTLGGSTPLVSENDRVRLLRSSPPPRWGRVRVGVCVRFGGVLAVLGAMIAVTLNPSGALAEREIRFGSVAMDIPAEMYRRLAPLTKYLGNELGQPVVLKLSPNMTKAVEDVSSDAVDFTYLTPVAYIRSHALGKTRLVAKMVTSGKGSFQLMIVVREDSPIRRVGDLAGRTFAFGDKAALLQRAVVAGAGMSLENLGKYEYVGHYDVIARKVRDGDFDAGVLKDTTALEWEGKGLRILHRSPHLPPYCVVASPKVDEGLLKKVREAFLRLDEKNPAHRPVIQSLDREYDGFAPVTDAEYDVVRRLIAPFDKREKSPRP